MTTLTDRERIARIIEAIQLDYVWVNKIPKPEHEYIADRLIEAGLVFSEADK